MKIHVVFCDVNSLFIFIADSILFYTTFIYPFTDGHPGDFQFLRGMNKAAIRIQVRVFTYSNTTS